MQGVRLDVRNAIVGEEDVRDARLGEGFAGETRDRAVDELQTDAVELGKCVDDYWTDPYTIIGKHFML